MQVRPQRIAAALVDVEAGEHRRQRCDGRRVEYRYGGAATLSSCLTSLGQAMNAASEEQDFEKPPTSTSVVALARVGDDALPRRP